MLTIEQMIEILKEEGYKLELFEEPEITNHNDKLYFLELKYKKKIIKSFGYFKYQLRDTIICFFNLYVPKEKKFKIFFNEYKDLFLNEIRKELYGE